MSSIFPANIWIVKFFILIVFAIKLLLDKPYGLLNLLEFKCDHFSSPFQAESQFQNSNVGGKGLDFISQLQIRGKCDFR